MEIKVLGSGCSKCKTLEKLTREAVAELGISAEIEKVEDIYKILSYGVISTPALLVNQKLEVVGRVPSLAEIKDILGKVQ